MDALQQILAKLDQILQGQADLSSSLRHVAERQESYDDLELDQDSYTVATLAELLRDRDHSVTPYTIRRWIKEGRVQAEKDDFTRRLSIPQSEVRRILKSGGDPGAPASKEETSP